MEHVYADVPHPLWPAAERSVQAQLAYSSRTSPRRRPAPSSGSTPPARRGLAPSDGVLPLPAQWANPAPGGRSTPTRRVNSAPLGGGGSSGRGSPTARPVGEPRATGRTPWGGERSTPSAQYLDRHTAAAQPRYGDLPARCRCLEQRFTADS
ncbi:hypothetical protein ACFPJ1_24190 [Kribbella qitaiheensis]|uniref:hypothetical protein n=1 Tax=Kribbella qitaiheensis TaxID=1544730 RepID=UPI003620C47E